MKKTDGVIDFTLNSAASTVIVKFEDSEIGIDEIVKSIEKIKFLVNQVLEVPASEEPAP